MKKQNKINLITLGCSKNLVDSEKLLGKFNANGLEFEHDSVDNDANIVIINTCGFINDAKEESIETILDYAELKNNGKLDKLFVMGCLSQRYKDDLQNEIPEVDAFFGVNDFDLIMSTLKPNYKDELLGQRELTTPGHYAYLKIAEGCDRNCSFCIIPRIRGKYKSTPIEELVEEAEQLVAKGVKEIMLIAQDLSYYGIDLYKEQKLPELLEKLSDIEGLKWIRLHYAYPNNFPLEVLKLMRERDNICNYLDIPLQHITDKMLKRMKRGHDSIAAIKLLKKIRSEVPRIAIRTTMLVGHPGETVTDFDQLRNFVKQSHFERLGVFTYSDEEDTYSYINYDEDVAEEQKLNREKEIMEIQRDISYELNAEKIGRTIKVIIDRKEEDIFIGRTEFDSPEVDNEVIIHSETELEIGEFYDVKITGAEDFELIAEFPAL